MSISAPDVRTGSRRAALALERSFGPQRVAVALVLERSFDTRKLLAPALDTRKLLAPAFDTAKMLERTFDTGRVVRSFDTGKVLRQSFGTRRVAANLVSIDRALERSFDFGKVLERSFDTSNVLRSFDTRKLLGPAFDTSKVIANLLSAYQVAPAFDTRKLLAPAFNTSLVRVGREPASASPLMPISPNGPIPVPADPGWLHQLLNDEERFRAAAPYLAFASGGCMLLGLFLVALVDPAVRAALEILDAEASMASLIVALIALLAFQRK